MTQNQYAKTIKQIESITARGSQNVSESQMNRLKTLALECERFEKNLIRTKKINQK